MINGYTMNEEWIVHNGKTISNLTNVYFEINVDTIKAIIEQFYDKWQRIH